jgi:hypothetical protein
LPLHYLLTGEGKQPIIKTRGCADLGEPSRHALAPLPLPGDPESIAGRKFANPAIAVPGAGVGSWKRDGRYVVTGRGRRVYLLP